jgi:TPR repeat protein
VAPDLILIKKAVKAYEDGFNQSAYVKFKQAAAFGNSIAFRYLGLMHIKALGVKQDWAIGYAWIRLAAGDKSKENIELQQNILKNLKPEELEQSQLEYDRILTEYSASETLSRRHRWVQRQKRKTTGSRLGSQTTNVQSKSTRGYVIDSDRTSTMDQMQAFVNDYRFGIVTSGDIIPVESEVDSKK